MAFLYEFIFRMSDCLISGDHVNSIDRLRTMHDPPTHPRLSPQALELFLRAFHSPKPIFRVKSSSQQEKEKEEGNGSNVVAAVDELVQQGLVLDVPAMGQNGEAIVLMVRLGKIDLLDEQSAPSTAPLHSFIHLRNLSLSLLFVTSNSTPTTSWPSSAPTSWPSSAPPCWDPQQGRAATE